MTLTLQKVTLNGASRHRLSKGFILVSDGHRFVDANMRDQIIRTVNLTLAQQSDLSGFIAEARPTHTSLVGLVTPFLPIYDVAQRDIFMTRLALATSCLMQGTNQAGCRLAAFGVNPYSADTYSPIPALCADVHQIEVFDDGEIERIYNLYRQFLPELLAISTHSGIYGGAIQKDFSLRMRVNPTSFLPRYLSQFSAENLVKLERMMRKDYGLADLRQMDVNPLGGDPTKLIQNNPPLLDKKPAAIELRFVDAQCAYPFIRTQVILFQAIAMYGRSLARQGKRLPYVQDEVIDENKALAVQSGPGAILKPDPKFLKDDSGGGHSFHNRGGPERATTALLMALNGVLLQYLRELECQYWEIAPIALGAELRQRGKRCLVNYAEYQKYLFYTYGGRFGAVLHQQVEQLLTSPNIDYITDYNRHTYGDLAAEIERDWTEKLKPRTRYKGQVKWYNAEKRYGFIRSEPGDEINIQQADIEGVDRLEEGQAVTFEILERRGRLWAIRVRIEVQQRYTGRVVRFDDTKGFGFIFAQDVSDVYVHWSAVESGKKLSVGEIVSFETVQSDKGLRAVRVKVEEQLRRNGQVKWFDLKKCFGYITQADGSDIFFHQSDIDGVAALKPGYAVSFELGQSPKGPKAIHVRVTSEE